MSDKPTRFRVSLEFDVEVNPISVPDSDFIEAIAGSDGKSKQLTRDELKDALKKKGLDEAQIEEHLKKTNQSKGSKPPNYQMLLYPEYENWAAAQRRVQQQIMNDDELREDYIRELVRDLIRGRVDELIDANSGIPDLTGVIDKALQTLSIEDRELLRANQPGLHHDETELVDNSVTCRFDGLHISEKT